MRYRCLIKSRHHRSELVWCSTDWQRSAEAVNKSVLSQTCCHRWTSMCCGHICVMMMTMMMTMPGTELLSFLRLQEPYTGIQSEDQPISITLGSALHQRLCQQGLFRREPMTDCDVAGVFGQNGAIHIRAGGRERLGRGVGEGKRTPGETETRQSGEKQGETDGGGGETGKALTDSNGASWQSRNIVWNQSVIVELLSLSLRCGTRPFTVTICSVLSQFTLPLGCKKVTALYPSLSARLALPLFINCLHWAIRFFLSRWPAQEQAADDQNRLPTMQ